ncbi:ABC transporter family substrate-binding protein [Streptomyces sp. NPDC093085]|uniref:ABC transporter family substrate-binding protein n=1 Tax=Streptomyces sp. NPDC093085 TaxID=3155068 RepID=UPI003434ACA3
MSQVGAPRGRTCSRTLRSVALLTTGVLALPTLSACTSDSDESAATAAAPDIAAVKRDRVKQGGTVRWAVDTMPATLNAFQADADEATTRIADVVLPSFYRMDKAGRPQRNPDYLESAKIVEREPKQVVLYKLNQQAVWSDGREIGAPDFVAQWRALRGKDSAYWTARNAGYDRIEKIERGANNLEVRVTFNKPYADWKSLFTPLYPKEVTGKPNAFNDGARAALKKTAGPFTVKKVDRKAKEVTLVRDPRWWGQPAKLDKLVLSAVPRSKRAAALAAGKLDIADIDSGAAKRIALAIKDKDKGKGGQPLTHGPGAEITPASALRSWAEAYGSDEEKAELAQEARAEQAEAVQRYATEQLGLNKVVVRKSLEPAYTQLALNGESGPLADERVRRAVARALDRQELADTVLKPLDLPAEPPGSHLALRGQEAYADSSQALGKQDTHEALALLVDAGWTPDGARKKDDGTKAGAASQRKKGADGEDADGSDESTTDEKRTGRGEGGPERAAGPASDASAASAASAEKRAREAADDAATDEGTYIVGEDNKPGHRAPRPESAPYVLAPAPAAAFQGEVLLRQAAALDDTGRSGGMAGAYAPRGTAAPASPAASSASASASASPSPLTVPVGGPLGKEGKPLTLRFVLPEGEGTESLRAVGTRISRMLDRVGITTEVTKVADDSYFKDHIASGDYDLALYSWPSSAYPATDGRPIYAKPVPASDGSLQVEQNYTRVGTDHIDQLFSRAAGELNEETARDLVRQADARIWATAGSIPLYQRPQLVAVKPGLVNAGAFGFAAPRYEDIGWEKPSPKGPDADKKK